MCFIVRKSCHATIRAEPMCTLLQPRWSREIIGQSERNSTFFPSVKVQNRLNINRNYFFVPLRCDICCSISFSGDAPGCRSPKTRIALFKKRRQPFDSVRAGLRERRAHAFDEQPIATAHIVNACDALDHHIVA